MDRQPDRQRKWEISRDLIHAIGKTSRKAVRLMEVCGTHTVSIFRSGIRSVLPDTISLLSGPGCPVCVTDQTEIDAFIALARQKDVILTTFGDLMRVPGYESSLQLERSGGCDIRVVYSPMDALDIAQKHDPIFFPGGNIGDLAVNGTVNDLAMCGAVPLYMSVGLIIEEGLPLTELKKVLETMGTAARKIGIRVVTGDTKVVPRGAADKLFVNTSGVGRIAGNVNLSGGNARVGDRILVSGTIADHGVAVLTRREGFTFDSALSSDTAPLSNMVRQMLSAAPAEVHTLRDPTRGGVGTVLNEIALQSQVGIRIYEDRIPLREEVKAVCDLLGLEPLYIANEGKLIAFVAPEQAEAVLQIVRKDEYGRNAAIIGEVVSEEPGRVVMQTHIGGQRLVDMLAGEQLPRIC